MKTAKDKAPVPLGEVFDVSTHRHRSPAGSLSRRTSALVALVYLRRHDTLARIAAGFRISVG